MSASFDVTQSLLGPIGGQLALAFGVGCATGYAFCLRTVYKLLSKHSGERLSDCVKRIEGLKASNKRLEERIVLLEERLYSGSIRQMSQMRESEVRVLGVDRLGRPPIVEGEDE